jgi:HAD superfamily hydrolase (TIGR01509 family)
MIKIVLLDFAGVISNTGNITGKLASISKKDDKESYEIYSKAKINNEYSKDFENYFTNENWNEFYKTLTKNRGLDIFLKENKLPAYVASNHISSTLKKELDLLGLKNKFNGLFVSSDLECAKPDKLFFEKIIKKLNVKPNEIFFVDDQKRNLIAAKEIGLIDCHMDNKDNHKGNQYDFKPTYTINSLEEVNKIIKLINDD